MSALLSDRLQTVSMRAHLFCRHNVL